MYIIGDLVTRKSHDNDIIFKIISIDKDIYYLKGISVRLYADAYGDDLILYKEDYNEDDNAYTKKINSDFLVERDSFFYLPGKILHIDGDNEYLERCMNFYKKLKIRAFGVLLKEDEISGKIRDYLVELSPNIVVITGHDAYYKRESKEHIAGSYKNSDNFIKAIKKAREYEKDQNKLIIISGACQSNYEELIKAGANFASSPKRINIHSLDPAIVASSLAFSEKNKPINLIDIINKTMYKENGIGGIISNGTMYMGYPR